MMERRLRALLGLLLLLTAVVYLYWSSSRAGGVGGVRIPIPWLHTRIALVGWNGTGSSTATTGRRSTSTAGTPTGFCLPASATGWWRYSVAGRRRDVGVPHLGVQRRRPQRSPDIPLSLRLGDLPGSQRQADKEKSSVCQVGLILTSLITSMC